MDEQNSRTRTSVDLSLDTWSQWPVGIPPTLLAKELPGRQTEAMVPLVPLTALAQLTTLPLAFSVLEVAEKKELIPCH